MHAEVGIFCVELGIFVFNWAFLCRTMHFAVELGFFVSNECYNCIYTVGELSVLLISHSVILLLLQYNDFYSN